ncbi:alcohol oxidase [Hypoxylon cercidicola]|nr:alcohol oxidase [Hypoxylon cercidicola]
MFVIDVWMCLLVHSELTLTANALRVPRHATIASRQDVNQAYDFVIVGGGISGLTVADRLTEDPNVSVLVIEAGPFDHDEDAVLVPGAWDPTAYLVPDFLSEPDTVLNSQAFSVLAPRVVGGGSIVNTMLNLRAAKEEYDLWDDLGADGWNWGSLLPYFKKSENFTAPDPQYAAEANISWVDDVHGHDGPVQISYPSFFYNGSANWWNAALETGLSPTDDPNGGNLAGLFFYTLDVDFTTRTRSHARLDHYTEVKDERPNYHIITEYRASRIVLDGKKATGVEYLPSGGGDVLSVSASREVLIAAGALYTPQLLQLSGIWPKNNLDKLGIPVVADLPGVGANFQDHPSVTVPYDLSNNIYPNAATLSTSSAYDSEQRALYDSSREGAYVLCRGFSTNIAFVPLQNATLDYLAIVEEARAADPTASLPSNTDPSVLKGYKAQRQLILNQLEGKDTPSGLIHFNTGNQVVIFLLKPLSRGIVTINTTHPLTNPVLDFRTMADSIDLDMATALFLKNREIMESPYMQILGPSEQVPFSGSVTDEEKIKQMILAATAPSSAHQCCTAAMVPQDQGGVVDPDGKVYGIESLRVIDASILPMIPSAPLMPTIYALAERLADIIKQEYLP